MFITAVLVGLAGGLHCAGMCGPLVLAATARNPFLYTKIIYTLGRILTYGMMGALAGGLGSLIQLTEYQSALAFILGGLFLLMGFGAISGIKVPVLSKLINRFTGWLRVIFGAFIQKKGNSAFLILGMLNGLLPCGLTYLAMTYCLTLDTYWEGFLFMVVFGLGTVPLMTGAMWAVGKILNRVRVNYQKVSMILLIAVGSLIIGRAVFSHKHTSGNYMQTQLTTEEVLCR